MPIAATWMQPEIIILSEVRKRKTYAMYHLYVESKIQHKRTYVQNRNRLTDRENRPVGDEEGDRVERERWIGSVDWQMQTIIFRVNKQGS